MEPLQKLSQEGLAGSRTYGHIELHEAMSEVRNAHVSNVIIMRNCKTISKTAFEKYTQGSLFARNITQRGL